MLNPRQKSKEPKLLLLRSRTMLVYLLFAGSAIFSVKKGYAQTSTPCGCTAADTNLVINGTFPHTSCLTDYHTNYTPQSAFTCDQFPSAGSYTQGANANTTQNTTGGGGNHW